MKKLLTTFHKDMTMSLRSFYLYIEIIMALLIVAVLLFVVPESFTSEQTLYLYLDAELPDRAVWSDLFGQEQEDQLLVFDSEEDVRSALHDDHNAMGLLLRQDDGRIAVEVVLQGYESEKQRQLMETLFTAQQLQSLPGFTDPTVITRLDGMPDGISDRLHLLPVFLVLNSAMVGLFIIAAYIYIDKDEGTIRAVAVTPASIWTYLTGKVLMMLVTGLITGSLTVLAVAGSTVHFGYFLVIMTACNLFGSALGLLVASFFDSMTKSLGALYVVIVIMSLATVSYLMPSFSPWPIRILPAYPMLYAFRETLAAQPDGGMIVFWSMIFILAAAVLYVLAGLRYRKTLTI